MKRILLLIISLFLTVQTIKAQAVVLDTNGVTIKWTGTTVPSPYFIQANPRGTGMEWFAIVDDTTKSNITDYANNSQSGITYFTPTDESSPIPFDNIVTTLVTNMSQMFAYVTAFNEPINSWDVSNVTNMNVMFYNAQDFNQPIGSWNVSNVTDMGAMLHTATTFNQPIGSWNVSNVTAMDGMFYNAQDFNQPIGSWNVSNVTAMDGMFQRASAFNQPIGSWNVSNVTAMDGMFYQATSFNQNIGSWIVGNVTSMNQMFVGATSFNQPIGSWNVSNVSDMNGMFYHATSFNQNIGSWNVSNVTNMAFMFTATAFNQNIGSWNVGNVSDMSGMFYTAQLSTANYDDLLIGWSTIGPNESPLQQNVTFSGGNSNYCNGETAQTSILNTYGWTITDGGLDCSSLETETFDAMGIKLYPNPVLNVLNVTTDYTLINQPYTIIDGLGRVILKGKFNEVETAINVEQLSKGIYYIKLSDNNASKFIKE